MNVHLLYIASLEMKGVCNKSHCCDEDEWWETLEVGNSTLRCQLDTSAHANVISISQLQQEAPNAQVKKTKQILSDLDTSECHQEVTPPSLKDPRTESHG